MQTFSFFVIITEFLLMFFFEFLNDVWFKEITKKEYFVVSQSGILINKKTHIIKNIFC